jgi:nicotinamide-nucleotide amidase
MDSFKKAEIILVGDELLKGERNDTHLPYLGARLARIGVVVSRCIVARDAVDEIATLVKEGTVRADVLIVCGGLGPTGDDVTREGVARGLGLPLEMDRGAAAEIEEFFRERGYEPRESDLGQALFPRGAEKIPNAHGTAPGFHVKRGDVHVFVLPGPPREMRPMVEDFVLPKLKSAFTAKEVFTASFRTTGIAETVLAAKIAPILSKHPYFRFSSLPSLGGVDIVATENPSGSAGVDLAARAEDLASELKRVIGSKFYGREGSTLEGVVGAKLASLGATLSIAESLTGGWLGKRITDVPGSSAYFLADVVAYSNEAKVKFLGVKQSSLAKHGAVSEQVLTEMAEGVRLKTGSTHGLATTGIAGPSGGSEEKPVGLCYYGVSRDGGVEVRRKVFQGDRNEVRERVIHASLLLLLELLEADAGREGGSSEG